MASPFRWALYYENESLGDPSVERDRLRPRVHPRPLRHPTRPTSASNGRFVVFVYAGGGDGCGMADRWKQANAGINAYIVLKVFSGYQACASQPDSWHQYGPATRGRLAGAATRTRSARASGRRTRRRRGSRAT